MDQCISNTVVVNCNANTKIIQYQNHHDSRDVSHHSVVPVGHLRSQSPTINRGKVTDFCQHPNVRDFLQSMESDKCLPDLICNSQ